MSIEAEAWLMAQPRPLNLTSWTTSFLSRMSIRILSPHSGFESSNEMSASASSPVIVRMLIMVKNQFAIKVIHSETRV